MVMESDDIEADILDAVQELGEEVFIESQRLCPENSGWLKTSGQLIPTMGGFEIIYEAPHARLIHDGKESDEQYYEQKVKRHRRRRTGMKSPLALKIDTKGIGTGNPNRPPKGNYDDLRSLLNLKRRSNTVPVKAHTKKFFGRRPMLNPETGEWKVVSTTARSPRPFIDDAYREVIKRKKYRDVSKVLGISFPAELGKGRQEILRRFLSI